MHTLIRILAGIGVLTVALCVWGLVTWLACMAGESASGTRAERVRTIVHFVVAAMICATSMAVMLVLAK